jgi:hypothetical protein
MPYFRFPCHYIYWTKSKTHDNDKKTILPKILDLNEKLDLKNPFSKCEVTTSICEELHFLTQEQIKQIVFVPILQMMKETNDMFLQMLNIRKMYVSNYWFNIYKEGEFQELHDHQNNNGFISQIENGKYKSILSVVYVLHDQNTSNNLIFKLLKEDTPYLNDKVSVDFDTSMVKDIGEGSVIVFSNLLPHEVKPIKIPGRITIAFNVVYEF